MLENIRSQRQSFWVTEPHTGRFMVPELKHEACVCVCVCVPYTKHAAEYIISGVFNVCGALTRFPPLINIISALKGAAKCIFCMNNGAQTRGPPRPHPPTPTHHPL